MQVSNSYLATAAGHDRFRKRSEVISQLFKDTNITLVQMEQQRGEKVKCTHVSFAYPKNINRGTCNFSRIDNAVLNVKETAMQQVLSSLRS